MIETVPYPQTIDDLGSSPAHVPPDAVTLELSNEELLEAVLLYVGMKRDECFKGHGWLQVRVEHGKSIGVRVTYWRLPETSEPQVQQETLSGE
jgi:hypothetical protein